MNKLHLPSKIKSNKKALVCYIPESYTLPSDHPNFFGHSNYQESKALLECLIESGYACDVLNWDADAKLLAGENYDLFIGIHFQLEYGRSLVHQNGKVILYATGCHWSFQNPAEYERLNQLRERKGTLVLPRRQTLPFSLEGQLDEIWYFGNDFQKKTYSHINVPKHRINISTIPTTLQNTKKTINDSNKNHFLWFGSAGCAHKGLDWLLEIFSRNPHLHLHVCGLVELEKDFVALYRKELFEKSNIHFHGWVLPNTQQYQNILSNCAFVVSPSCSEGGGGATLQGMSAGLIPLLSKATGIDTHDFGFTTPEDTIAETEQMILTAALLDRQVLSEKSARAQQFVQKNHRLEHYRASILLRLARLTKIR